MLFETKKEIKIFLFQNKLKQCKSIKENLILIFEDLLLIPYLKEDGKKMVSVFRITDPNKLGEDSELIEQFEYDQSYELKELIGWRTQNSIFCSL